MRFREEERTSQGGVIVNLSISALLLKK